MREVKAEHPFDATLPYAEIIEYLLDIFQEAKERDGMIVIRSGKQHAQESVLNVSKIASNLRLELSRHDLTDCFFTFATFRQRRRTEKACNIYAWSLDIDHPDQYHPLDVYQYILDTVSIPIPNYVEYGHRLRLIYLFSEPLRLYKKQRFALLNGFSFLQKSVGKRIQEELDFTVESNPVTSFFRMPYSYNSKDGSQIHILHTSSERLSLQEFCEEWITEQQYDASGNRIVWYEKWKQKQNHSQKKQTSFSTTDLWNRRIQTFFTLRKYPSIHREQLCFYYGIGLFQTHQVSTAQEAILKILEFNEGFENPLSKQEIQSKFRTLHGNYKVTDQHLASALNVPYCYFQGKTQKQRDAKRYHQKRQLHIQQGITKQQQILNRRNQVKEYRKQGYSIAAIAQLCKVSCSTIKRDLFAIQAMEENLMIETKKILPKTQYQRKIYPYIHMNKNEPVAIQSVQALALLPFPPDFRTTKYGS